MYYGKRKNTGPYSARSTGNGGISIKNREYVKDVPGSVDFTNQSFTIQPGNQTLFKWLSRVAKNFEEYKFESISFEFRSLYSSSVAQETASLGSIVMATDYNPYNNPFVGKAEMENYIGAQSSKPSASMRHYVRTHERHNQVTIYYINPDQSTPPGADRRLYDLGNFQFATQGQTGTQAVGELWVSYSVKLMKPKIRDIAATSMNYARWKYSFDLNGPVWGPSASTLFGFSSNPGVNSVKIEPSQAIGWASANSQKPYMISDIAGTFGNFEAQPGRIYFPPGVLKNEVYTVKMWGATLGAPIFTPTTVAGATVGPNLEWFNLFGPYDAVNYPNDVGSLYWQTATNIDTVTTYKWSEVTWAMRVKNDVTQANEEISWISPVMAAGYPAIILSDFKLEVQQKPSSLQYVPGQNATRTEITP